jgi:hypothetical protein
MWHTPSAQQKVTTSNQASPASAGRARRRKGKSFRTGHKKSARWRPGILMIGIILIYMV